MDISEYKEKLLSNPLMEPMPELSGFVRENRNKQGILLHKKFNVNGSIERRDSYNGIIKDKINSENFFDLNLPYNSQHKIEVQNKSNIKFDEVDLSDILVENKIESNREEKTYFPLRTCK